MKLPVQNGEKLIEVQGKTFLFKAIKEQAFSLFFCNCPSIQNLSGTSFYFSKDKLKI